MPWGSDEYSGTWPRAGTTRSGTAFRQQPSAPLTGATASSLWPTPTASDHKGAKTAAAAKKWGSRGANLPEAVQQAAAGDPRWPMDLENTVIVFDDLDRPMLVCSHCMEPHEDWHGPLNPAWVEYLMGFPLGWTLID